MGVGGGVWEGRQTFSRGKRVSMVGKESKTPAGVETIGHVERSWFSNACAPSRAVAARSSSNLSFDVRRSGFGSLAKRSPRSKV